MRAVHAPVSIAAAVVLLVPFLALAESWRAFGVSSPNVLFSVDEASLKREGSKAYFVERLVFVVPVQRDASSGQMIKEKRVLRVMDCAARTQGYLRGSLLAADGRLIEAVTTDPADLKMTAIPTPSLAAEELGWACAAGKQP